MINIANINENDRKALFQNTAAKVGMTDAIIEKVCHPRKNGHKKASKNEMNRRISLVYENQSHLFHGLLDNEPLPA